MSDSLKMLLGVIVGYTVGTLIAPVVALFWIKVVRFFRGVK